MNGKTRWQENGATLYLVGQMSGELLKCY